ncbi:hypothetical protein ACFLQR_02150, partial [Verrucomicrobiota bacterium]
MRQIINIATVAVVFTFLHPGPAFSQRSSERDSRRPAGGDSAPIVMGKVVKIDNSTVVVLTERGNEETVTITERTSCVRAIPVNATQIQVGDKLFLRGARSEGNKLSARGIDILDKKDMAASPADRRSGAQGPGREDGPVVGQVIKLDPLTISRSSGENLEVEMTDRTKVMQETLVDPLEIKSDTRVLVVAPPRPRTENREAVKLIVLHDPRTTLEEESPIDPGARSDQKAAIIVDYDSSLGSISPYIAGTTAGPSYDKTSFDLLKDGQFKVVQVMIWLSRPRPPFEARRNQASNEAREKEQLDRNIATARSQIRSIFEIG